MDKSIIWAWAIKNSICMICWTILAIVFNNWGIALFSLLFMSSFRTITGSYRICDKCGKHSPHAQTVEAAKEVAKANGWFNDGNKDYCPECRKEIGV